MWNGYGEGRGKMEGGWTVFSFSYLEVVLDDHFCVSISNDRATTGSDLAMRFSAK